MPFTCGKCGGHERSMKAERNELSCTRCGDRRSFIKPPLFIVTGAAGSGKSTACQRLAGTINGVLFLDADTFADEEVLCTRISSRAGGASATPRARSVRARRVGSWRTISTT